MRYLAPTILLLASCADDRSKPEPTGELYVTPKHAITYYGNAQDGVGIDEAADSWLEWCEARLINPGATLTACVVYVRDGATIDGVHEAYWHPSGVIEVARNASAGDSTMNLHHEGVLWLRHEWLHELYRDPTHNQFPGH